MQPRGVFFPPLLLVFGASVLGFSRTMNSLSEDPDLVDANASSSDLDDTNGMTSQPVYNATDTSWETFGSEENRPTTLTTVEASESDNGTASTHPVISSMTQETLDRGTPSNWTEDEAEGVVRGQPSTTAQSVTLKPETLYQKAATFISDTYTLSILVPVASGIVFASTIIVTIVICRCLQRQCRRRKLRRKALPDSVKNLRPSDRARLLAESSDDEF